MFSKSSAAVRRAVTAFGVLAVAMTSGVGWAERIDDPLSAAECLTHTALWLGMEGDEQDRQLTLQYALHVDPDCALARWHLGQLRVGQQWLSIEQAEHLATDDQLRQQYRLLRDEAADHWQRELSLARWCHRRNWDEEERLHLSRVLMNGTSSQAASKEARRKLGLRLHYGLLLSDEEIRSYERKVQVGRQALEKWVPLVRKWRKAIDSGQARQRRYALADLRSTRDTAAIPALESQLSSRNEQLALEVTSLLKNMPEHAATQSLVRHAVGTPWSIVFEEVVEELKRRPLHSYAPTLLYGLVAPIQSAFHVTVSAHGTVRHQHLLFREGARENQLVTRDFVASLRSGAELAFAGRLQIDRMWEMRFQAALAALRARRIENNIAQVNAVIREGNQRMYEILERTTGMALPRSPSRWWEWWQEYNEIQAQDKPTYTVADRRVKNYGLPMTMIIPIEVTSCFAAGTQVRTQTGRRAIEAVKIGDRVLSQDPDTGELTYKLVLRTTRRPPSPQLKISVGGADICTTKGHPFWVNRVGWRMAKRLDVGDSLHSLRASHSIDQIEDVPRAPAYNLVVADFGTYFVSEADLLVHDNTYRAPTTALTPGLLARSRIPARPR